MMKPRVTRTRTRMNEFFCNVHCNHLTRGFRGEAPIEEIFITDILILYYHDHVTCHVQHFGLAKMSDQSLHIIMEHLGVEPNRQ